jgi:transcriptional regulator with XRE-family HTH domain
MTQTQVAKAARVSRSMVSLIEQGRLEETSLLVIRRVGSALGMSLPFDPRWRGVELAKLLDERHAALLAVVVKRLTALGWQCVPEHTFNEWGERGSVDVLAWHATRRAALCVEIKTRIADLQGLLSTEDRKRRLASTLAWKLGWAPLIVGSVVVLPEETWARNALTRFRPVFDAKFPLRTVEVRDWLKEPSRDVGGIWFLVYDVPGDPKRRFGGSMRVRLRKPAPTGAVPRSGQPAIDRPDAPSMPRRGPASA